VLKFGSRRCACAVVGFVVVHARCGGIYSGVHSLWLDLWWCGCAVVDYVVGWVRWGWNFSGVIHAMADFQLLMYTVVGCFSRVGAL
jgi:hypothetical protein